jgi:hypothetical protein
LRLLRPILSLTPLRRAAGLAQMTRQHATPLLLSDDPARAVPLTLLPLSGEGEDRIDEAYIRDLIFAFPTTLPISEIDRQFIDPVSICTELRTDAGAIDVLLVTPQGLPILVECKLWRNAQARREVIGQILDYAKELASWTASNVQQKVSQRLQRPGNAVWELVHAAYPEIGEIDFNDALTQNLRRGRFLLMVVGDGIREAAERIAEYVQDHAGLHFTFGLVEFPIFVCPDGQRFVAPRVLAHTEKLLRTVIALPEGFAIGESVAAVDDEGELAEETLERREGRLRRNAIRQAFWHDFLSKLQLDDPEQPFPPAARGGHIVFKFGAPGGSSWLTVYRDMRNNRVGLALSSNHNSIGESASQLLADHAAEIAEDLGSSAIVDFSGERPVVTDEFAVGHLEDADDRARAISWLQHRTNDFVNALRPRIRAALRDLEE